MKKRILLLSAYDALSHQHWRTTLSQLLAQFRWTQLALPPRHFSWRVRGNSLSWGFGSRELLEQDYDLLIATSMVDLASLRGFVPALAKLPTLVYFHENQFAYPVSPRRPSQNTFNNLDAAMVSLYSALCADQLAFNSDYNRRTFLAGISDLLTTLPDHVPTGIEEKLAKSVVLPVPLGLDLAPGRANRNINSQFLDVVWNHRWEYDKGIDLLFQVVSDVVTRKLPVRFHILGQQFRRQPAEFQAIKQLLTDWEKDNPALKHQLGFIADRNAYLARLSTCDVVLSTARHDFQGLAILEASSLGCTPLCPAELVYPEYLESQFLYPPIGNRSLESCATGIFDRLRDWQSLKASGQPLPKFVPLQFSPQSLKESYLALIESLVNQGASG